jgi:hypothetical protein
MHSFAQLIIILHNYALYCANKEHKYNLNYATNCKIMQNNE